MDVAHPLQPSLAFGPFELDLTAQRLTRDGLPVALRPRYFDVLVFLAGSGGRLVSKDELLDAVWGHRHVSESVLKVAINALRVALGDDAKAPRHLETVSRRGYRFVGAHSFRPGPGGLLPRPAVAASSTAPTAATSPTSPGNLPAQLSTLVGRADELQRLLTALATQRLVTLHGTAGVGKTRLALAAAQQQSAADGVWLLRLDALANATLLLHTLARTLGLGSGADADVPALARALAPLRLLLVLDSAEHMAAAVATLASALLSQAPGVRLLVTSQLPLRVAGEQLLPLSPLALPAASDDAATGAASAAVQLLQQRALQHQPGLPWDDAAVRHAVAISRLLDGLPLALELAAARVPLLGWAGVHTRLGERLALLTRGERGAPERHRTLRAALAWSCALLQPAELRLLQHLSVFAGGFTLQGAGAVAGISDEVELLDTLDGLLEHALLNVAESAPTPRWRLFDSVRSFAAEGLHAQGLHEAAVHSLLNHLAAVFEQADRDVAEAYHLPWLRSLEPEVDNLRGAFSAALPQASLRSATVRLFCASAQYRSRAGWLRELRRDHAVISVWPQQGWTDAQQAAYDLAIAHLCAHAQVLPPETGLASVRRAKLHLQRTADARGLYTALNLEAGLQLRLGVPYEERLHTVLHMQALQGDDWSPVHRRMGAWQAVQLRRQRGDDQAYEAAATTYMATARALGDDHGVWVAAQVLAQIQAAHGHFENAISLLERTAFEMRAAGLLRQNTAVLAQWALLCLTRGADEKTLQLLQEAVQALVAEGMLWWLADALAWVPAHQGRWADALRLLAWADGLAQRRGEHRGPLFAAVRRHWDDRFGGHLETRADAAVDAQLDEPAQPSPWRGPAATDHGLDETSALALAFCAPASAGLAPGALASAAPAALRYRAEHG